MTVRVRVGVELLGLAAASCGAVVALSIAQRALWSNGLVVGEPFQYPRPGADTAAGAAQSGAVVVLGLVLTALFAVLVLRAPRYAAAGLTRVALVAPVVVALGLLLTPPALSIDVYSYLSHGYLAATPGTNPYLDASASVGPSPYGAALAAQGWQPVHPQSPYGPLWTAIERLAVAASGGSVPLGVLLVKLPVLLAVLGTALLIAAHLRDAGPARRLRGVLLFLANPLVLVELAGEGHVDGLMAGLLVLAVVAAARRRAALAVVALALAVLVKPNALPFALPIAVALVAMRRSTRRLVLEAIAGGVVATVVALLLVAPYWAGSATFTGLAASGAPSPGWSVSGLLDALVAPADPGIDPTADPRAPVVQAVLIALLVVSTAAASLPARTADGLVRACGIVSLVVLLLLPLEWPWYAALPSAVLPLEAGTAEVAAVIVLAAGSRIVAPIGDAASIGVIGTEAFTTVQALVGQTVPAVAGLALTVGRVLRHRFRGPGPSDGSEPIAVAMRSSAGRSDAPGRTSNP